MNEFKFRAECIKDVITFFERSPKISFYVISSATLDDINRIPDVDVYIKTTYTLEKILMILSGIDDSHIMIRTLNYVDKYTGDYVRMKLLNKRRYLKK